MQSSLAKVESTEEPLKTHKPSKPKNNHKKSVKPPKDDYDNESTDSECELDLDVEDGISVQVQDELSKKSWNRSVFTENNVNLLIFLTFSGSYLAKNKIVGKLSSSVRDFLAAQRLDNLFKKDHEAIKELNIRSRAAFIPLDLKSRRPCPVSYRG